MSDNIPEEVVKQILLRLPVKSLIQCTTVCKSWYTLITSSAFISSHTDTTLSNTNTHKLLLRRFSETQEKERFSLRFDNENLQKHQKLECPLHTLDKDNYFRIVGVCNGLVCLFDDYFGHTHTFVLWNPAIRKYVKLPMPRVPYMFALGFGFDSKTNDYKVVRVAYLQSSRGWDVLAAEAEVYSLKTGSWRDVGGSGPMYNIVEQRWAQVFMNGAVHWIAYNTKNEGIGRGFRVLILLFDMGDEAFRTMEVPGGLADGRLLPTSISVFGGSLAVLHYCFWEPDDFCHIWMMKEYGVAESWTKQFTIDLRNFGRPLFLRKNGEILCATRGGELVSCEIKSQQSRGLKIFGDESAFFVGTYWESMVLLDKPNGVVSYIGAKKNRKRR